MKMAILVMTSVLILSFPAFAKTKKDCRTGYQKISCDGVKGATKKYFCSKKKPSEKRKAKICKRKRKA